MNNVPDFEFGGGVSPTYQAYQVLSRCDGLGFGCFRLGGSG